jgi:hypothetical protein
MWSQRRQPDLPLPSLSSPIIAVKAGGRTLIGINDLGRRIFGRGSNEYEIIGDFIEHTSSRAEKLGRS